MSDKSTRNRTRKKFGKEGELEAQARARRTLESEYGLYRETVKRARRDYGVTPTQALEMVRALREFTRLKVKYSYLWRLFCSLGRDTGEVQRVLGFLNEILTRAQRTFPGVECWNFGKALSQLLKILEHGQGEQGVSLALEELNQKMVADILFQQRRRNCIFEFEVNEGVAGAEGGLSEGCELPYCSPPCFPEGNPSLITRDLAEKLCGTKEE